MEKSTSKRLYNFLPLHFFDDTSFDDYSSEEWMEKVVDQDGT